MNDKHITIQTGYLALTSSHGPARMLRSEAIKYLAIVHKLSVRQVQRIVEDYR